jgi:hypothetical protein
VISRGLSTMLASYCHNFFRIVIRFTGTRGSTDYPVVGVTVDRDFKIIEDKKMFINRTIFKTCILK